MQQSTDRGLFVMRNIDRKKLDRKTTNLLYGNNHSYLHEMWEYDISSLEINNKKHKTKLSHRFSGNEIFASCLIVTLLSINFGGSYLIKNRTQQKLIYNSIPQVSSTASQK